MFELPSDLLEYIEEEKQLSYNADECECGELRLVGVEELLLYRIKVKVDLCQKMRPEQKNEEAYYIVPMVNLVSECEHYMPDFILTWLPVENRYATYNSTHELIEYFPDIAWGDIVRNPIKYINAQWQEDKDKFTKRFSHNDLYEFVDVKNSSIHMYIDS